MPCVHNRRQLTLLKLSSFLFYSSETDEEEDFLHDKMQKRQRKFDPYLWERSPVQEVVTLPCGIDGLAVYILTNLPAGNDQQAALLSLRRKWKKSTVTQWKRHGPMRYADCRGSIKCKNAKSPFRIEYGVVNRTQVNKNKEGIVICQICGEETEYVPCPARPYIRKGKKNIKVFHWGSTHALLFPNQKNRQRKSEKC